MIPLANIRQWRRNAPWLLDSQVEQDLVLSRALVEIYSEPLLQDEFAFRGGTALNKLFLRPATRYSEDIDLVRIKTGPIGPAVNTMRDHLDGWLGEPTFKQTHARFNFVYRFESTAEPITKLRLKIEINTRENPTLLGFKMMELNVDNPWFKGCCLIKTYPIEELLASKFCALYQRKKGRDLFDILCIMKLYRDINHIQVKNMVLQYFEADGIKLTRALMESNLAKKLSNKAFMEDITPLLPDYVNHHEIYRQLSDLYDYYVKELPGDPWKIGYQQHIEKNGVLLN